MAVLNYTPAKQAWTKERIVELIQAKAVDGYCKSTDVGMSCTTMARRLFGSFKNALIESGVKLWSDRPKPAHCNVDGCDSPIRSSRSEYCELHYYRLRRNGTLTNKDGSDYINPSMHCVYCNKPTNIHTKYCSQSCNIRHLRQSPIVKQCSYCKASFDPRTYGKGSKANCCSKECLRLFDRQKAKEYRLADPERYKHRERAAEYKRKSLKRAVAYEDIDRALVFARDNYICQLCFEPVDMQAKWPDRFFATLDHIKPLSKGGSHTYSNVQTAHLKCNCINGNRVTG
jgi:5-methylcytosine-specific restriction endonuclease McrA